jgi:hypothetical protein
MQLEQMLTVEVLLRRLKIGPVFRVICGFKPIGKTLRASTFSRFIEKLSKNRYNRKNLSTNGLTSKNAETH